MEIIYRPAGPKTVFADKIKSPAAGYKTNKCREYNGHYYRGEYCTLEECENVLPYSFCFDVGAANLCGLAMYEFIVGLGDKLGMVLLRDNNGRDDSHLLPYTSVSMEHSHTDWHNVLRALRRINFSGTIVIDYLDSALAMPTHLRYEYCQFVYKMGEYIKRELNIEERIRKYPKKVLFGAGNMCRNYIANYGEELPPLYICDNNRALWGKEKFGFEVISPQQLYELEDDVAIFVCNMFYDEVLSQLRGMGLKNPIEYYNDEYSLIP